jgi:thiol-disulfide isomerase/thioredoxin
MSAFRWLLVVVIAGSTAAPVGTRAKEVKPMQHPAPAALQLPIEGVMPSFDSSQWINSPPLTRAGLEGKVVLVEFWTYSCINWLRTLPYVRAWAAKYKDRGLVVIGVHSPEFGFEKDLDNVRRAVKAMDIPYPVVIDNAHAIWRAFDNEAWPALYFVDAQGRIRHRAFGEGEYDHSERVLQQLLAEAGVDGVPHDLVAVDPRGFEVAADWAHLRTPETYVGYERTENFASPGGPRADQRYTYSAPANLGLNHWALSGDWTMGREATVLSGARGSVTYRFHARDLHLVMGPPAPGKTVRFRVLVDGKPPGPAHGEDVDDQGYGALTEQRLYQLIRQPGPVTDRTFQIEFLDAGVETFSFTFG